MASKRAYIQVGTSANHEAILVKEGDILQLVTGEKITFTGMRRTKFEGIMNGRSTIVPIWRNKYTNTPFVTAKLGVDKSVIVKPTNISAFKIGDLFKLEGSKETFLFGGTETSRGKQRINGIDLATGKSYRIGADMSMTKINLSKIKKEALEKA